MLGSMLFQSFAATQLNDVGFPSSTKSPRCVDLVVFEEYDFTRNRTPKGDRSSFRAFQVSSSWDSNVIWFTDKNSISANMSLLDLLSHRFVPVRSRRSLFCAVWRSFIGFGAFVWSVWHGLPNKARPYRNLLFQRLSATLEYSLKAWIVLQKNCYHRSTINY